MYIVEKRQRKEDMQRESDRELASKSILIVAHDQRIVSLLYTFPKDKIKNNSICIYVTDYSDLDCSRLKKEDDT